MVWVSSMLDAAEEPCQPFAPLLLQRAPPWGPAQLLKKMDLMPLAPCCLERGEPWLGSCSTAPESYLMWPASRRLGSYWLPHAAMGPGSLAVRILAHEGAVVHPVEWRMQGVTWCQREGEGQGSQLQGKVRAYLRTRSSNMRPACSRYHVC